MTATTPTAAVQAGTPPQRQTRTEKVYSRMRSVADNRAGVVVLFCWAFTEALMWPLIPDSALMGMSFAAPRRFVRLWIATVAGTLAGGAAGFAAAAAGMSWPLPLVTDRMEQAVDLWLGQGAAGLWHQPLSGVPYKTFVAASGSYDIGVVSWLSYTAAARGGRMLLFGLVAAAAGRILIRYVPMHRRAAVHVSVVTAATAALFAGLALVIFRWS